MFALAVPNQATGGVAVVLHKSLMEVDDITQDSPIVPGRCFRVCVLGPRRVRVFWSTHNFGLTAAQHTGRL